jgi:SagB-type dehydrogenase family enzyme
MSLDPHDSSGRSLPRLIAIGVLFVCFVLITYATDRDVPALTRRDIAAGAGEIKLPGPPDQGTMTVEEALRLRRSVREFGSRPLSLAEIGALLWAAQGITSPEGFRTAPSAGALYPLEIYLLVGGAAALPAGLYHYQPRNHSLRLLREGDLRPQLQRAALDQEPVGKAPCTLIIAGVTARTAAKYADRAERYVLIETGHAAQNVCLEATNLGLALVTVGAFHDDQVRQILKQGVRPLYLLPFGPRP